MATVIAQGIGAELRIPKITIITPYRATTTPFEYTPALNPYEFWKRSLIN